MVDWAASSMAMVEDGVLPGTRRRPGWDQPDRDMRTDGNAAAGDRARSTKESACFASYRELCDRKNRRGTRRRSVFGGNRRHRVDGQGGGTANGTVAAESAE